MQRIALVTIKFLENLFFKNIQNLNFAIVKSEWNSKITDRLTKGLEKELKKKKLQ